MGLSFSEEVTLLDEKNQQIQELETENKQLRDKLYPLPPRPSGFEFVDDIVLTDPKRLFNIQISENFNEDFEKETNGLETDEDVENYKKLKGIETDEELDRYVEQHKEYEVRIEVHRDNFNRDVYTRYFKNRGELDDFKKKFVEWAGSIYSNL
jgi:hypothetical protein